MVRPLIDIMTGQVVTIDNYLTDHCLKMTDPFERFGLFGKMVIFSCLHENNACQINEWAFRCEGVILSPTHIDVFLQGRLMTERLGEVKMICMLEQS